MRHGQRSHRLHKGFTVVELVIVIAVIGILATIIFVRYGNIRQQAENVKTATAVNEYGRMIAVYRTVNLAWPSYNPNDETRYPCLGTFPDNKCMSTDGTIVGGLGVAYGIPGFNNEMKTLGGELPNASTQVVTINGHPMVGAFVDLERQGNAQTISFWFVLAGADTQCNNFGITGTLTEVARSSSGVLCGVDKAP